MSPKEERKLAAIMFADIVGYSRMMSNDEEKTLEVLKDFESLCLTSITGNHGTIIKKLGDGFFCEFSSAKKSVDSALELQKSIQTYNDSRPIDFRLEIRIGIHVGDVLKRENDVFGDGVNVASRIVAYAKPGGICISNSVKNALSSHPHYKIQSKGQHELKNIIEKHSLYDIETGFEAEEPKIPLKNQILYYSKLFILPFILITSIAIYFIFFNKQPIDNDYDTFLIHFASNDDLMQEHIKTRFGNDVLSYNIIDSLDMVELRNKVIPLLNSKIATTDFQFYYPETNEEYIMMEKLPIFDDRYAKNNQEIREKIPGLMKKYNETLNNLNKISHYFDEKHEKHIDWYILVHINEETYKNSIQAAGPRHELEPIPNYLNMFPTGYYYNNNEEAMWTTFSGVSNRVIETWNTDSLDIIYNEVVWRTNNIIKHIRYGGSTIGYVEEILDDNLISINLRNTKAVKGMLLEGIRIYSRDKTKRKNTLKQMIADKRAVIDYYEKNPAELDKPKTTEIWEWYIKKNKGDMTKVLQVFHQAADSLEDNYVSILEDWEGSVNYTWDLIMQYNIEIIKINDNKAIAKIIKKKNDYVFPMVGDMIRIEGED